MPEKNAYHIHHKPVSHTLGENSVSWPCIGLHRSARCFVLGDLPVFMDHANRLKKNIETFLDCQTRTFPDGRLKIALMGVDQLGHQNEASSLLSAIVQSQRYRARNEAQPELGGRSGGARERNRA